MGLSPVETYDALKQLFNSGDVLGNVSDAVKQSYIERIDNMEAEYQKAGASGSFNSGIVGGKVITVGNQSKPVVSNKTAETMGNVIGSTAAEITSGSTQDTLDGKDKTK
ncbi:hypothetical protein [Serratia plymuthica]|uniref:hypothetical protein n=1 Tax=Serratia plymuthica TaxID=82996 RepID=UPI0020160284|nr:hypothetical protein [Serratia plymuthica]